MNFSVNFRAEILPKRGVGHLLIKTTKFHPCFQSTFFRRKRRVSGLLIKTTKVVRLLIKWLTHPHVRYEKYDCLDEKCHCGSQFLRLCRRLDIPGHSSFNNIGKSPLPEASGNDFFSHEYIVISLKKGYQGVPLWNIFQHKIQQLLRSNRQTVEVTKKVTGSTPAKTRTSPLYIYIVIVK